MVDDTVASPAAVFTATLIADEPLGAGVRRLWLELTAPFASLLPGQYVGLHAADGELVYFSVASIAADLPRVELHYAPMPGSPDVARMDELLGAPRIRLTEPQGGTGMFAAPQAGAVVLIAAATGISQAIAILRGAAHAKARARIRLYWGVRDAAQLYARALLDELAASLPDFEWIAVVSDDANWGGRDGLVVDAALADGTAQAADLVILSGGPAMVQASAVRLIEAGVARTRLHSDLL